MGSDYLYTGGGARSLSPFYSPDLKSWGLHIPFTYAFFVIWVPLGFRLTCYYYRKAYYRAFFLAPVGRVGGGCLFPRLRRPAALRRGPWLVDHACQRRAALAVYVRVQLAPPSGWRQARLLQLLHVRANSAHVLAWRQCPEWSAYAVGLDQPRRRGADRPVHPARFGGCVQRPEDLLSGGPAARVRRARNRRGGGGPSGGDRVRRAGCPDGGDLQVAARQGAHSDGRGRGRGFVRQRRRG